MDANLYGRKENKIQGKYVFRWLCGIFHTTYASLTFWAVWISYTTVHNQTGNLTGLANRLMALLIYAFIFVLLMRSMGGYLIGVSRKMNVVGSIAVALFITDGAEVFISLAITGQFRFFWDFLWRYIIMFFVQVFCIGERRLRFLLRGHPPPPRGTCRTPTP